MWCGSHTRSGSSAARKRQATITLPDGTLSVTRLSDVSPSQEHLPRPSVLGSGSTDSTDFPSTFGSTGPGIYLAQYDANGTLTRCTVMATTGAPSGLEFSDGRVYVAGQTSSATLPVSGDAHQADLLGPEDAFLLVYSDDLGTLQYGTYLGGSNDLGSPNNTDRTRGLIADPSGVYIVGQHASTDFPTVAAPYPANQGAPDGFIARFDWQ